MDQHNNRPGATWLNFSKMKSVNITLSMTGNIIVTKRDDGSLLYESNISNNNRNCWQIDITVGTRRHFIEYYNGGTSRHWSIDDGAITLLNDITMVFSDWQWGSR